MLYIFNRIIKKQADKIKKVEADKFVRLYLFMGKFLVFVSSKVKILPRLLFIQHRNASDFDFLRYAAFFFGKNKSFLRKFL